MSNKVTDAIAILDNAFKDDVEYQEAVAKERINALVARDIQRLRKRHGLTQKQLADLVGTKQSAISRLEKADYDGHSITMFEKIARALNYRIEFRLVPDESAVTAKTEEPSQVWTHA